MVHASSRQRLDPEALGKVRARRWWVSGRRIGSIQRAAAFIEDVGFALLFPASKFFAPSLWDAVSGGDAEPFATGMNADEQKVWTWKDELPRRGLCWYGAFLAGRGSFLSPDLLAALYPAAGNANDHESLNLSDAAHEIAQTLSSGPMPSAALRQLIGNRNVYQRAISELQRQLLVTNAGVQEHPTGWPSALLALTCDRFDVGGRADPGRATERFLETMIAATPHDLRRAFGWSSAQTLRQLDALVETGRAIVRGDRYVSTSRAT
jgi:hypothetical protein